MTIKAEVRKYTNGSTRGFATAILDDQIKIPNIVVMNGKYGIFCKFPEIKGKDGNYYPVVYLAKDLKKAIEAEILKAF